MLDEMLRLPASCDAVHLLGSAGGLQAPCARSAARCRPARQQAVRRRRSPGRLHKAAGWEHLMEWSQGRRQQRCPAAECG